MRRARIDRDDRYEDGTIHKPMFRVYTGDRGFGQLHGNVAVRRRTTQGHKFSSAFIISTGYSVKGDRIRAAMQIAARPVL